MKKLIVLSLSIIMIAVLPLTYSPYTIAAPRHHATKTISKVKNSKGAVFANPGYKAPSGPVPYSGIQQNL